MIQNSEKILIEKFAEIYISELERDIKIAVEDHKYLTSAFLRDVLREIKEQKAAHLKDFGT